MGSCHEIVELTEQYDSKSKPNGNMGKHHLYYSSKNYSIEEEINKLFETIDISRNKSIMKKPMRVSGIGISEPVSLKQALRGLCISQASEMAAIKKRTSKISASIGVSISLVPERSNPYSSVSTNPKKKREEGSITPSLKYDKRENKASNSFSNTKNIVSTKSDEKSRGENSQSSKSSVGEYSSNTSYSEESLLNVHRPHMSKDLKWDAVHSIQRKYGSLSSIHFKLVKKLGCGDIGTVYLSELIGTSCLFAMKIMDKDLLAERNKISRAQTEKEILEILDHPFLPTLYAHFTTSKFSCLVMEHCPGGDLHVLRQKQTAKRFSEQSARFYVAEVLLALEYLHMLGVVYRDLKPENILIREDGHIMLSDFDLSLKCIVNHTPINPIEPPNKIDSDSTCIDPFCLNRTWQISCFTPNFLSKSRKLKPEPMFQITSMEPTNARSNSFVGTHEYLSPEIVKGDGHGSAVDWWTLGIFLYELLYGKTPFKGSNDVETISNVTCKFLELPESPFVSYHARDLIKRLLVKEPENRLGAVKGAGEIKKHLFFEGLNWALVRCEKAPEVPELFDVGSKSDNDKIEFEMF